jgi:superfamily II DNA/RNA helicase
MVECIVGLYQSELADPESDELIPASRIHMIAAAIRGQPLTDGADVDMDTGMDSAANGGPIDPTMVFANSAKGAAYLAAELRDNHGIDCVEFHKQVPDIEKRMQLDRFRKG